MINKITYIVIHCEIDFNNFYEEYNQNYINKITYDFVRDQLGLDASVRVKRNGTWERDLTFTVSFGLVIKRVIIQKMLVYDMFEVGYYISVFPQIIIKYCPLSSDLLEEITVNVPKGEDILKHINDPRKLFDSEDYLANACANMENRCIKEIFTAILAQKLAVVTNKIADFKDAERARYPNLLALCMLGQMLFLKNTGIFSELNVLLGLY